MLILGVRTTLKTALPTTPVKMGSSTLMISRRSRSTASQPLARPISSRSENKVSSTRNTTEMDSRRLSPRGRVGDLFVSAQWTTDELLCYHQDLIRRRRGRYWWITRFCLYYWDLVMLHTCYLDAQSVDHLLRLLFACARPSFHHSHEYVRWRVTYVSDILSKKEESISV
jgi:hypothetical protein